MVVSDRETWFLWVVCEKSYLLYYYLELVYMYHSTLESQAARIRNLSRLTW
jgi:hypothetical protein